MNITDQLAKALALIVFYESHSPRPGPWFQDAVWCLVEYLGEEE